ncbi:MAG: efflux RND transporter periplasmic adaptor subunit [Roseibacillus sp.]
MKPFLPLSSFFSLFLLQAEEAPDSSRVTNTIILTEQAVQNLGIETVIVEEENFETTVFAIGRLEEIPSRRSVLSSRIPGRVVSIDVYEGDQVQEGQALAQIESRQPGNPPPTISLVAPRSGLVVSSHARVGQPVEPDSELLDITDRSMMWAVARIPEQEAAKLSIGSAARLRIPAVPDFEVKATLTRYGLEADRDLGTVSGIFEIPNPKGLLQPGMRVEFSLITEQREDVLSIPRDAIQGSPTDRVVFLKDFELENAFIKSSVVLGEWNQHSVEVISGVFPGDEVVTKGSYPLSFAGGGGGISLKEALDAAHGHEHNEDGSIMTDDQKSARAKAQGLTPEGQGGLGGGASSSPLVLAWAITATVLFVITAQLLWNQRRKEKKNDA